jgi:rhamnose utilization protein RhaD (predicted bifunctional aldolase and dehydrogenase)
MASSLLLLGQHAITTACGDRKPAARGGACTGFPIVMRTHQDPRTLAFARRDDVAGISQQGPATPDHVIRTKRVPLVGFDVAAFAAQYQDYFGRHAPHARETKTMLDPAPRIVLDAALGMCTLGRSPKDAAIVADLYHHNGCHRARDCARWLSCAPRTGYFRRRVLGPVAGQTPEGGECTTFQR